MYTSTTQRPFHHVKESQFMIQKQTTNRQRYTLKQTTHQQTDIHKQTIHKQAKIYTNKTETDHPQTN